ncbi:hypothetical protein [Haloprofundus sp. MHR1]|uniref:hypothetical protein n=1 Tax=Haloprofundus sp. MHR1 TaxID=2572921 RepID=UPI0010BF62A4|nr:hypothetical protein [Haloprofundus sp. MHR1]QCJ47223.1 hypothetical protein FCF25_08880 [Haloprofundus sp. MHR1]
MVEILYEPSGEYPYPEQIISRGTFEYTKEGILGTSSAEGSFQLRPGSGMFVVRMSAGSAQMDEIVDALDEKLDSELGRVIEVHSGIADHSNAIWHLLEEAKWISSVAIRFRGERTPLAELREEKNISMEDVEYEYPIIEADFILETPWGAPVNVIYEDGKIEVATDSDETHEYVLQLLEAARAQ